MIVGRLASSLKIEVMFKKIKRYFLFANVVVGALAVYDQMKRPAIDRSWHGSVGPVPYDFRPPNPQRFIDAWWNPEDSRLFTPRDFGIGWAVNLHRAYRLLSPPKQELE